MCVREGPPASKAEDPPAHAVEPSLSEACDSCKLRSGPVNEAAPCGRAETSRRGIGASALEGEVLPADLLPREALSGVGRKRPSDWRHAGAGRPVAQRVPDRPFVPGSWCGEAFMEISQSRVAAGPMAWRPPFLLRVGMLLLGSLAGAVLCAPVVSFWLGWLGYSFPFARIFDRVFMVSLVLVTALMRRWLSLQELLASAYQGNKRKGVLCAAGFLAGAAATALIVGLCVGWGARWEPPRAMPLRLAEDLASSVIIGMVEETFFRAFFLGGLAREMTESRALAVSSVTFALAHLLRAPAGRRLLGFHPWAGLSNLEASFGNLLLHPLAVLPAFVGLALLGLLLGEVFLAGRSVYLPAGLHAGFVFIARLGGAAVVSANAAPRWLLGYGRPSLLSGPAAWVEIVLLVALVRRLGRWVGGRGRCG